MMTYCRKREAHDFLVQHFNSPNRYWVPSQTSVSKLVCQALCDLISFTVKSFLKTTQYYFCAFHCRSFANYANFRIFDAHIYLAFSSPYKSMFKTEPLLRSRKLHLSSSESAFNDQTSLTYNTFPCNSSLNSNRSTERRCRSEKSQSSSDVSSKINGASNLWLSRSRETAGKSRLRSDTQRCFAAEMSDSSVARTDRKFNSTRQVLRNTMNNINTLSDLVSTVETSQSLSASLNTTPLPSRSPLSNAMVSVTFDPEDSQLLEDIFFIN